MAIVYAQELHIAHLDDGSHTPRAPVKISTFEKSHWKIVPHPVQPHVGPKVAELTSVWWLDVAAVFSQATSNAPTKAGRYKVQWRMNLNVAETDNVVVGTEFRAITFRKDEVCFPCLFCYSARRRALNIPGFNFFHSQLLRTTGPPPHYPSSFLCLIGPEFASRL